jgi:hypothetical protein
MSETPRSSLVTALRSGRNLTPMLLRYERESRERRVTEKRCICPSHASNRGECPIHDDKGRVR